jgi:hypothetical protein
MRCWSVGAVSLKHGFAIKRSVDTRHAVIRDLTLAYKNEIALTLSLSHQNRQGNFSLKENDFLHSPALREREG